MHRAIADRHLAVPIEPGNRVLQPEHVVALRKIVTRMSAAAFGAVLGRMQGHDRLLQQVLQFEGFHQIAIPDHRAVGDCEIAKALRDAVDLADAVAQHVGGAEHRAIVLHRALHLDADLGGFPAAFRVADAVEPSDCRLTGIVRQWRVRRAGTHKLARPNTTISSSELQPSRLAPCTETQAASPTAISPDTTASGSLSVGRMTSP